MDISRRGLLTFPLVAALAAFMPRAKPEPVLLGTKSLYDVSSPEAAKLWGKMLVRSFERQSPLFDLEAGSLRDPDLGFVGTAPHSVIQFNLRSETT